RHHRRLRRPRLPPGPRRGRLPPGPLTRAVPTPGRSHPTVAFAVLAVVASLISACSGDGGDDRSGGDGDRAAGRPQIVFAEDAFGFDEDGLESHETIVVSGPAPTEDVIAALVAAGVRLMR